jgi:predicted  nucleic acid-binding Zn-ribbon protein
MAEITNELMFEQLKAIRSDMSVMKSDIREIRDELRAVKSHVAGLVQSDLNRDSAIASLTQRVERIERRLELTD